MPSTPTWIPPASLAVEGAWTEPRGSSTEVKSGAGAGRLLTMNATTSPRTRTPMAASAIATTRWRRAAFASPAFSRAAMARAGALNRHRHDTRRERREPLPASELESRAAAAAGGPCSRGGRSRDVCRLSAVGATAIANAIVALAQQHRRIPSRLLRPFNKPHNPVSPQRGRGNSQTSSVATTL